MTGLGAISIMQNVEDGYTETLCVKCGNTGALDTIEKATWTIKQDRNCMTALNGASTGTSLVNKLIDFTA